jgi:hypothetical protein
MRAVNASFASKDLEWGALRILPFTRGAGGSILNILGEFRRPDVKVKFGYQLDENGNWVVNEKEASIVRLIFDLYVNHKKSMEVIAGRLPFDTKPGVLGGNIWNRDHVRAILNDPEYAGCGDASLSAGSMRLPPLLSPDQFDEAQRRRAIQARRGVIRFAKRDA